jgi:nucleoside-diphosphate-sugar epimerase
MTQEQIVTRTIPPGSTVLVTGANGLIASHVVDQLLAAGYCVRATVRTPAKCAWMGPLYTKRHGHGRFELIQVSKFSAPGAWDAAVRGVAGIAQVAGGIDLAVQDFEATLREELPMHISVLEAASKELSVKSFAFTSSAWAAFTPDTSRKLKLTEWTWNDEAIKLASSDSLPQEKGISSFMALKVRLEQEVWKWVKDRKPHFTFNTILLDTVLGECLDPVNQGLPSTAGMVHWVWTGENRQILDYIQPQWHIDTHDTGLLYVAALTTPGVDGERLYGCGDRFSWHQVREILKRLYPNKNIPPVKDLGSDQNEVPNQRGAELLRGLGREGWTSVEESVKANALSFLQLESVA